MSESLQSLIMFFILIFSFNYAESTGLLCAFARTLVFSINMKYVFHMSAIAAIISGAFGRGGACFAVMLCAAVFNSMGVDPRAGVLMGYVASTFGRYVCILISPADVFLILPSSILRSISGLSGLSITQASLFDDVASIVCALICVYMSVHILSPALKTVFPGCRIKADVSLLSEAALSQSEKQGLRFSLIALVLQAFIFIFLLLFSSDNLFKELLLPGFLFFILFLTSFSYGIGSGEINNIRLFLYYIRFAISLNCISPGIILLIFVAPFSISYPISSNLIFRFIVMTADMLCPFSRSFKFALSMFNFYNTGAHKKATAKDMFFMLLPYVLIFISLFVSLVCIFSNKI